jgi:predicted metal-dependent peptidase
LANLPVALSCADQPIFVGFDRRLSSGAACILTRWPVKACKVYVAVDTSGSIDERHMTMFMEEVQGIWRLPHITCDLFFIDSEAHGPSL